MLTADAPSCVACAARWETRNLHGDLDILALQACVVNKCTASYIIHPDNSLTQFII